MVKSSKKTATCASKVVNALNTLKLECTFQSEVVSTTYTTLDDDLKEGHIGDKMIDEISELSNVIRETERLTETLSDFIFGELE